MPRPAVTNVLLASVTAIAAAAAEATAAIAPPPRGQDPQLTAPMQTPSGARSPARHKLQRKGSMARAGFQRVPAPGAAPAQPATNGGTTRTATGPGAEPDPAALARALALPENADFRAWYESDHSFAAPRPDMSFIPFGDWPDDDACVVRHEGNKRFLRPGCTPRRLQVRASVDRAYGEALESHFGFPAGALARVACGSADGSCDAVEAAVVRTLDMHGIACSPERLCPDHQWILDRSVPALRGAASAIVSATWGRGAPVTRRQQVEALAGYVQNAVPYRPVKTAKDDLMQDGKRRCGLRTPIATLFDGGDCDSKSLLLASLLRAVDPSIPVSLVFCDNDGTPHMVLAVGCAAEGDEQTVLVEGAPQLLVETTSDWDLGHVGTGVDLQDLEFERLR